MFGDVSHRSPAQSPELIALALLPLIVNFPGFREIPAWSLVLCGLFATLYFWRKVSDGINYQAPRQTQRRDPSISLNSIGLIFVLAIFGFGYVQGVARGVFSPFNWITQFASFVGIVILAVTCARRSVAVEGVPLWMTSIIVGTAAFFFVNCALLALSVRSEGQALDISAPNRILDLIGINFPRIAFPISGGQNGTAIYAVLASAICLAAVSVAVGKGKKILIWSVVALCTIAVALTDARGGYLGLAGVFCCYFLRRRLLLTITFLVLAVLLLFVPLVAGFIVQAVPLDLIYGAFGRHVPTSFDSLATLTTGRSFIWESAFKKIDSEPLNFFFGYGVRGHMTSGISIDYRWLFGGNPHHTLHSMFLQMLFEFGLVGLVAFSALGAWIVKSALRSSGAAVIDGRLDAPALAVILITVGFLLCGANEAVLSSSFPDHFIFLGVCIGVALSRGADPLTALSIKARKPVNVLAPRRARSPDLA